MSGVLLKFAGSLIAVSLLVAAAWRLRLGRGGATLHAPAARTAIQPRAIERIAASVPPCRTGCKRSGGVTARRRHRTLGGT